MRGRTQVILRIRGCHVPAWWARASAPGSGHPRPPAVCPPGGPMGLWGSPPELLLAPPAGRCPRCAVASARPMVIWHGRGHPGPGARRPVTQRFRGATFHSLSGAFVAGGGLPAPRSGHQAAGSFPDALVEPLGGWAATAGRRPGGGSRRTVAFAALRSPRHGGTCRALSARHGGTCGPDIQPATTAAVADRPGTGEGMHPTSCPGGGSNRRPCVQATRLRISKTASLLFRARGYTGTTMACASTAIEG